MYFSVFDWSKLSNKLQKNQTFGKVNWFTIKPGKENRLACIQPLSKPVNVSGIHSRVKTKKAWSTHKRVVVDIMVIPIPNQIGKTKEEVPSILVKHTNLPIVILALHPSPPSLSLSDAPRRETRDSVLYSPDRNRLVDFRFWR